MFTEELVGVLREGVPDGPEMLALHGVFEAVHERMARRKLAQQQEPQVRDDGGVGTLSFVRNVAVAPPPQAQEPAPPHSPSSRRRLWWFTAGALALGMIAGFTVVPRAVDWWHERNPQPAGGVCSDRAKLLSYSDALDKQQVLGEKVEGLSALALTRPTEGWALTDNAPGRIFPLRLGGATKLEPRVQRAKTLRTPSSGTAPSQWFDGEGLVVERSGKRDKTVLVASETGPAIRRFSMTTGKQVGKALPIPPQFRARPKGDAQAGRTLESLAASADGRYLYAAMEGPLATDGDARGRNLLRIQRYRGTPGGAYKLDRQYAYKTGEGMYVAELATAGDDRLLALERQYVAGIGNTIRIYDVPLQGAASVDEHTALYDQPSDVFLHSRLLVDLADCPAGDAGVVPTTSKQLNPLLQNVEGMALGEPWTKGPDKGHRPLYLISDDNGSSEQITRVYALSVRLDR
ncbi:esterase-like activity of phytase family protein [Streptomyces sp. NPDC000151]|uniref:esterase-like activity of phytase family protein n=1 Tax=Streptomyces sp. NPDC000151 TaxID=3154244 RepID=UPI00332DE620